MKCDNCGREYEEWQLKDYCIGRKKKYLCAECVKHGTLDATIHDVAVSDKKRKKEHKR
jgi:hypothetical protein